MSKDFVATEDSATARYRLRAAVLAARACFRTNMKEKQGLISFQVLQHLAKEIFVEGKNSNEMAAIREYPLSIVHAIVSTDGETADNSSFTQSCNAPDTSNCIVPACPFCSAPLQPGLFGTTIRVEHLDTPNKLSRTQKRRIQRQRPALQKTIRPKTNTAANKDIRGDDKSPAFMHEPLLKLARLHHKNILRVNCGVCQATANVATGFSTVAKEPQRHASANATQPFQKRLSTTGKRKRPPTDTGRDGLSKADDFLELPSAVKSGQGAQSLSPASLQPSVPVRLPCGPKKKKKKSGGGNNQLLDFLSSLND